MSDLLTRLRDTPCNREPFTPGHAGCQCRTANEAADRIGMLEAALRRIADLDDSRSDEASGIARRALEQ